MIVRRLAVGMTALLCLGAPAVPRVAAAPIGLFHRPVIALGANQSSNWSGYNQGTLEQNNKLFNQVSAIWRVPTARQHQAGEAEYSSAWIGIGGGCIDASCTTTDSTLIQAGTEMDVDASGTGSYSAWYELIPAPSITIAGLAVHPGDVMSASIAETTPNSNVWTIDVHNVTTGGTFSTTVPYSSTHATAEWIVETPVVVDDGGNVTIGPLPHLTRTRFNQAETNGAGAGLRASEEMILVDPNTNAHLATPSRPDHSHDGFNDCTYTTTCAAPTGS